MRVEQLGKRNIHIIHPFKTHSLRLRNQEPDIEEHREAARAKEEVSSITRFAHMSILKHMRDGLRNDEVEQPLSCRRKRYVHGSQSRGRYFGDDDPAARTPAKLEEGGKKEDAGESEVAHGWDSVSLNRRVEAYVEADHEHGEALGDGGPEEGPS